MHREFLLHESVLFLSLFLKPKYEEEEMQQLNVAFDADHFVPQTIISAMAVVDGSISFAIRKGYAAAAEGICGIFGLSALPTAKGESRSFGDYLEAWFSRSSESAQHLLQQAKLGATKVLTRREVYDFTEQEVCKFLERAIYLMSSGVEDQFLSDRLEPWIGLARPISHNVDTRVYYWPEIEI